MLRFASSPIGDMHIGNLRVAIFNYIVSKQKNEDLIIKIEDTDKEKEIEGKDDEILDILGLFAIEYTQVIHQSQNARFYSAMALQLMHEKKAFSCFCSAQYLEKKKQEAKDKGIAYKYDGACENLPAELVIDNTNPFTIRIKKPNETIFIKDHIKGDICFEPDAAESFIILRQDKTPTDNFACAIDDMLSDISLVIRTEDYINNSPKQDHIRESLGYDKKIEYAHLPIIQNDKDFSIKWLLQEGYLPSAITNYLILLGNKTPQEIFTMQESVEWFSLDNISKDPARFDIDKLKFINTQHMKNLDAKELSRYVGFADAEIGELAKVYLEEVATTKELKSKIEPIFAKKIIPEEFKKEVETLRDIIKQAPYFEEYKDFEKYIIAKSNLEKNDFLKPLCLILTGTQCVPDISKIYKYLKNYLGEIVK